MSRKTTSINNVNSKGRHKKPQERQEMNITSSEQFHHDLVDMEVKVVGTTSIPTDIFRSSEGETSYLGEVTIETTQNTSPVDEVHALPTNNEAIDSYALPIEGKQEESPMITHDPINTIQPALQTPITIRHSNQEALPSTHDKFTQLKRLDASSDNQIPITKDSLKEILQSFEKSNAINQSTKCLVVCNVALLVFLILLGAASDFYCCPEIPKVSKPIPQLGILFLKGLSNIDSFQEEINLFLIINKFSKNYIL
jgi:hypothetical protein